MHHSKGRWVGPGGQQISECDGQSQAGVRFWEAVRPVLICCLLQMAVTERTAEPLGSRPYEASLGI